MIQAAAGGGSTPGANGAIALPCFGTRLAGGCTSGHGIFGLANLERPSLITTITFMAAGIVTTQIVYRVIVPLTGL